jgi:DNA-directed RNA polymerase sigma subunit (sigma70/sigma32)
MKKTNSIIEEALIEASQLEEAVKEVGKKFKISWKQVRKVEKNALSKLLSSEEITDFVDNYHNV